MRAHCVWVARIVSRKISRKMFANFPAGLLVTDWLSPTVKCEVCKSAEMQNVILSLSRKFANLLFAIHEL